jgi:glycosyltransferase involved in cell wall biosynthesis
MQSCIVLHDYFAAMEGGGRLSSLLARALPCDLGYGFARRNHPFLDDIPNQRSLGLASIIPLWQQYKLARGFATKTKFLQTYQQVIYSGTYAPLAVANHPGRNILYCHTPPRFIYDQKEFYLQQLSTPLRPLLNKFIDYLQPRYEQAAAQMDVIIANSKNVQQRIRHYLQHHSQVIYPPCDTKAFTWHGQENYYISTARLDPLKRVELIIQAFTHLPQHNLIVVSGGSEWRKLSRLARNSPNIKLLGWVNEQQLHNLIGNAIASIYIPHDEDFGMSPVESQAAGKPVIGVAEGGLLETVMSGQTGILLPANFIVDDLIQAIISLDKNKANSMRKSCENNALRFDISQFIAKMQAIH